MLEKCKQGNHNLIEIMNIYKGEDEYKVVRWCRVCGAIVVDLDVDGRTYPGYYTKMIIPKNLKENLI